jgi:aminoglycoside phosphotransferase family enzyme
MIIRSDHDGESINPIFASENEKLVDEKYSEISDTMDWSERVQKEFKPKFPKPIKTGKKPELRKIPDLTVIPQEKWAGIVEEIKIHNAKLMADYEAKCAALKAANEHSTVPSVEEQKKEFFKLMEKHTTFTVTGDEI